MGLCNSPDILQEKMNEMFRGIELIRAYINDLLIIMRGDWSDQINQLKLVLKKLRANILKCNMEKSVFGQTKMEYMVFWVTYTGIQQINKKVKSIVNTMPPINQKQVRSFIGIVNCYRYMWSKQ